MRMRYELSKPPNDSVHRSESLCASISADFPRHVNQRNNDGKRADDLADCTNSQHDLSMIGRIFVKRHEDSCAVSLRERVQESPMTFWPDHLPSGNQKREP
jgi:hypothetical protein